jgi:hypothetical protein
MLAIRGRLGSSPRAASQRRSEPAQSARITSFSVTPNACLMRLQSSSANEVVANTRRRLKAVLKGVSGVSQASGACTFAARRAAISRRTACGLRQQRADAEQRSHREGVAEQTPAEGTRPGTAPAGGGPVWPTPPSGISAAEAMSASAWWIFSTAACRPRRGQSSSQPQSGRERSSA